MLTFLNSEVERVDEFFSTSLCTCRSASGGYYRYALDEKMVGPKDQASRHSREIVERLKTYSVSFTMMDSSTYHAIR